VDDKLQMDELHRHCSYFMFYLVTWEVKFVILMPSSHRRQDYVVVLYMLAVWTEVATSQEFSVVLSVFETEQFCPVPHLETGQNQKCSVSKFSVSNSLDLSPFQFTPLTPTRREFCLVHVGDVY